MARGRFLSRTLAHCQQLAAVSLEADYLFARCIPHLDSAGRMAGHPTLVKAIVCPLREEVTPVLVTELLRQLAGVGLLLWYEVEGKQVLEFTGFKNHQKGMKLERESASDLPSRDAAGAKDLSQAIRLAS